MDILKELYCGNICPIERGIKKGPDYKKALNEVCVLEDALREQLTADGKKIYDAYMTKHLALMEM